MAGDARGVDRLLRMERLMTEAYDNAMAKVNDARLNETLGALRSHHQGCAQTLQTLGQGAQGAAPRPDPEFGRYAEELMDTIGDAVRRDEAIGELRIAEAGLRMTYGQVLEELAGMQAAETVKSCMRSEKEHLGVLSMAHDSYRT